MLEEGKRMKGNTELTQGMTEEDGPVTPPPLSPVYGRIVVT